MKTFLGKYSYGFPFIIGIIIFFISLECPQPLADLLINISASLITIPIVIFSYEKIKERAGAAEDKETSEFVKMNLDTEILNILNRIVRILYGNVIPKPKIIIKLLSLDKETIESNLREIETIGFWLATDWSVNEEKLTNLLSSQLIHQNLSVEERNSFIKLIRTLRSFEYSTAPRYFMSTGVELENFQVVDAENIDKTVKFKNRQLLLKKTTADDKFVVYGFNDIKLDKYNISLLTPMRCNEEGRRLLISSTLELIDCITVWLHSRGSEFILDSKHFRIRNN